MSNIKNCIDIVSLSHKTLFILCGFPYAGKSYVAEQIISQTDVTYVSIDNVFSKNDFNWNENKLPNVEE